MSVSDPNFHLGNGFTLQSLYCTIKKFPVAYLHHFFAQKCFTSNGGEPVIVLDYGCGPVVAYDISVVGMKVEIVLAENGAKCRSALNPGCMLMTTSSGLVYATIQVAHMYTL